MNTIKGIKETNVYGVQVQGFEGRCGMAAVTLEDLSLANDAAFWETLYKHLEKNLPPYARPYFVMIQTEIEVTSTFKHKKVELVRNGFNPQNTPNKIFFRDESTKSFILVDKKLYEEIQGGSRKL